MKKCRNTAVFRHFCCQQVFLLKDHPNAFGLQQPHSIQAVHRVPGEPGQGFGEDHVDASPFTGGDHAVELRALLHTGSGQALVSEDPCHLPVWSLLNFLRVVGLLSGVAVELLLAVGGHPAVGRHPLLAVSAGDGGAGLQGGGDHPHPALQRSLFHGITPQPVI